MTTRSRDCVRTGSSKALAPGPAGSSLLYEIRAAPPGSCCLAFTRGAAAFCWPCAEPACRQALHYDVEAEQQQHQGVAQDRSQQPFQENSPCPAVTVPGRHVIQELKVPMQAARLPTRSGAD